MRHEGRPGRLRLGLVAVTVFAAAVGLAACGSKSSTSQPAGTTVTSPTTTAAATTNPAGQKLTPTARLILKLLKRRTKASLPASLRGSQDQAAALSAGSRAHHAAGAIVTTNGGALVGYLVFRPQRRARRPRGLSAEQRAEQDRLQERGGPAEADLRPARPPETAISRITWCSWTGR